MRTSFLLLSGALLFASCASDADSNSSEVDELVDIVSEGSERQLSQVITHYYSIGYEEGEPVADSIKGCFSCNQSVVYDKEGKETELRFYQANMQDMYGYERYRHDEQGRKIGSDYYDGNSLTTRYDYELDSLGRIAVGRAFDVKSGDMLYGYVNRYDAEGNHVETGNMNSKGDVVEYYRREFNKYGVATSENIVDLNGEVTFKIAYDYRPSADTLWVAQLTSYNDSLAEIRVREKVWFD